VPFADGKTGRPGTQTAWRSDMASTRLAAERGARVGEMTELALRTADGGGGALGTARVLLVPWLVDGWLASPSCH
jgi:hypothetical protein